MKFKRHTNYYFINKTTKALDSLRVIDLFEDGFIYLYKEEYKFCSYKNAEGKLYKSDTDRELLNKLGKCRQSCYYNFTHRCSSYCCPCPIFLHVSDPAAIPKSMAKEAKAKEESEYEALERYLYGDR